MTMESQSGSNVLALSAVTETPTLVLESIAGTDLLTLTAGVTNSQISAFDDLTLRTNGADALTLDGGTQRVTAEAALSVDGEFDHNGSTLGVFATAPTTKQTVTGSRGANAALASLLTALAAYGLVTDSSTA